MGVIQCSMYCVPQLEPSPCFCTALGTVYKLWHCVHAAGVKNDATLHLSQIVYTGVHVHVHVGYTCTFTKPVYINVTNVYCAYMYMYTCMCINLH